MKKRGFGEGRFNGVGGKRYEGETIEQAAVRETQEEIAVDPIDLHKVAILDFYFLDEPIEKDWNQQVVVYFCTKWNGTPKESEEMKPKWFDKNNLPFNLMWSDDPIWLPQAINGRFVRAEFGFGKNQIVAYRRVRTHKA